MSYELISTIEIGAGGASSIEFTGIPQDGTDLLVVCSTRATDALVATNLTISFNQGSYSGKELLGNGSSVSSSNNLRGRMSAANATANTFGSNKIYISNYTASANHSLSWDGVSENNGAEASQTIVAGLHTSSSPITSLTLLDNFVQYSTASLYKITAGDSGQLAQPKATGGTVSFAGGYWYHTFTSSGTFTPTESLSCEYLVVAGGGGGGGNASGVAGYHGGGGGAGGLRYSSTTLSADVYSIVVGAGGAGGSSSGASGSNGSTSSLGALLSSTGGGGGGTRFNNGKSGGSGGGGGGGITLSGGAGTSGQGNNGGGGGTNSGGGGGGRGAAGGTVGSPNEDPGDGGIGVNTYSTWATATLTGESGYYAGGGGGSGDSQTYFGGVGGLGGGGNGGYRGQGDAGDTNTGGGGGGSSGFNGAAAGGNGGSGVVIVRYAA